MTSTYFHQGIFETDDGAPLWFESRGEAGGVPVVLNDGLGCDGFIWRYLWEPLSSRRRVLHWNYRGHGKSGVPTDDTRIGMEYITDDLARLILGAHQRTAPVGEYTFWFAVVAVQVLCHDQL